MQATKKCVSQIFVLSVKRFQLFVRATSSILHLLHNFEHLTAPLAELLAMFAKRFDSTQFVGDVIRFPTHCFGIAPHRWS